jgi:hypothetical protein
MVIHDPRDFLIRPPRLEPDAVRRNGFAVPSEAVML